MELLYCEQRSKWDEKYVNYEILKVIDNSIVTFSKKQKAPISLLYDRHQVEKAVTFEDENGVGYNYISSLPHGYEKEDKNY